MTSKLIIIHGGMASGKTTIVNSLSKKLPEFILVDRAYIKDIMLKNVKKTDPVLAKRLSNDAVFLIVKGLVAKGHNILLQEVRATVVKKELGNLDYSIRSFYLHCSVEKAKKRDSSRQKRYKRPEVVEEMHKKHAYGDKSDIIIDTEKNTIEETVKIILESL